MFVTSFARARHLSLCWARSCQSIRPSSRPCGMFLDVPSFTVRSYLAPRSNRSWRTTPCRLSATNYYNCSYPPYLKAVPRSLSLGRAVPCWQGFTYHANTWFYLINTFICLGVYKYRRSHTGRCSLQYVLCYYLPVKKQ